jgi:hypothetical protein
LVAVADIPVQHSKKGNDGGLILGRIAAALVSLNGHMNQP